MGHLTVNGFDPAEIRPNLLRRHVALVRGVEVFQGTIDENVHLPAIVVRKIGIRLKRQDDWLVIPNAISLGAVRSAFLKAGSENAILVDE